jgi:type II secretory pathway pseudopilin PulG
MSGRLRGGYTLVEASVVILILVMAAAVIRPRAVSLLETQRAASFRTKAFSLFRSARDEAILSGRTLQVVVSDDGLAAEYLTDDPAAVQEEESDLDQDLSFEGLEVFDRLELPETVQVGLLQRDGEPSTLSEWSIEFYPTGEATPGSIEIDSAGRIYHFAVNRVDGKTTMAEGEALETEIDRWEAGELETRIEEG